MSERTLNHLPIKVISNKATSLTTTSILVKNVCLQSHPENMSYIYIGNSLLSKKNCAAIILPGGSINYEAGDAHNEFRGYYDLKDIYVLSEITGQKLIISFTESIFKGR